MNKNTYKFLIDTNSIKQDNIFTVTADNLFKAKEIILSDIIKMNPTYINIVLVYTDDKLLEDIV